VQMHPTRSGFLSDYSGVECIESMSRVFSKGDARLTRLARDVAWDEIDSFYIEPVSWMADDLGQPASSKQNADSIRDSLRMALVQELGAIRPIAKAAGPRTATVRSAVTGVQEGKPIINLITLALSGPLFNGGAVVELEIVAPDGAQIVAASVAVQGRDWEVLGFFHKPRHAENAVRRAAGYIAADMLLVR